MSRRSSLVTVVVSAACFGTLAILTGLAYREGASPLPLLAWRFALVTLLMAAYQLVRDARALVSGAADIGKYAALSLTGYGAASVCFFFALKFATASVVAVLLYTYPAMVALLSAVSSASGLPNRLVAIALTFIGCALVVGLLSDRVNATLPGVLLGLGAALGYSVFNLVSYRVMGGSSAARTDDLHLRHLRRSYRHSDDRHGRVALHGRLDADALGTARSRRRRAHVPGRIALPQRVRRLGPAQAAIVSTTEPLFTIIMAAMFLGERLDAMQLLGAALVVAGVVAAEWRQPPDGVHTEELAAV